MIKCDYHTHTLFCDGKASVEDMVLSAIEKGLDTIGISGHAYTSLDTFWCMSLENTEKYIEEVKACREKYSGKIKILLGTEQDYFSDGPLDGYDYRIGSVHYVALDGKLVAVDETAEDQQKAADAYFGGDLMALAEKYYETEADVLEKTGADFIGHFNLIEKFNEGGCMYDPESERYRAAWQKAADKLLTYGKPFEINTGAISRGYRTEPYPSREMMQYIHEHGGCFIMSSDSHRTDTLCFEFDKWEQYALEQGYRIVKSPI